MKTIALLVALLFSLPAAAITVPEQQCDDTRQTEIARIREIDSMPRAQADQLRAERMSLFASVCKYVQVEVPGTLTGAAEIAAGQRLYAIEQELATIAAADTPDEVRAAALIAEHDATQAQLYGPMNPGPKAQRVYDSGKIKKFKAKPPKDSKSMAEALEVLLRQQQN